MKLEALLVRTSSEETEGNIQEVLQSLGVAEYNTTWGSTPVIGPNRQPLEQWGEDGWALPGSAPDENGTYLVFVENFD